MDESKEIRINLFQTPEEAEQGDVKINRKFSPGIDCSTGDWEMAVENIAYSGMIESKTFSSLPDADRVFYIDAYSSLTNSEHSYMYEIPSDALVRSPRDLANAVNLALERKVRRVISNTTKLKWKDLGKLNFRPHGDWEMAKRQTDSDGNQTMWSQIIQDFDFNYVISRSYDFSAVVFEHRLVCWFNYTPKAPVFIFGAEHYNYTPKLKNYGNDRVGTVIVSYEDRYRRNQRVR